MRLKSALQRRKTLSLTSLIDVIFLLLLFFMLSTSFSKYVEIPLAQTDSGVSESSEDKPDVYVVELGETIIRLNREDIEKNLVIETIEKQMSDRAQIFLVARDELNTESLIDFYQDLKSIHNSTVTLLTDQDENENG